MSPGQTRGTRSLVVVQSGTSKSWKETPKDPLLRYMTGKVSKSKVSGYSKSLSLLRIKSFDVPYTVNFHKIWGEEIKPPTFLRCLTDRISDTFKTPVVYK